MSGRSVIDTFGTRFRRNGKDIDWHHRIAGSVPSVSHHHADSAFSVVTSMITRDKVADLSAAGNDDITAQAPCLILAISAIIIRSSFLDQVQDMKRIRVLGIIGN